MADPSTAPLQMCLLSGVWAMTIHLEKQRGREKDNVSIVHIHKLTPTINYVSNNNTNHIISMLLVNSYLTPQDTPLQIISAHSK